MRASHYVLIGIVIVAVIGLGAYAFVGSRPQVTIGEQPLIGNQVILDRVYLDRPGYAVIHTSSENGTLGPPIGNSGLISGARTNVTISLSNETLGGPLMLALYYDNGDGLFDSRDTDRAVLEGNTTVYVINATGRV